VKVLAIDTIAERCAAAVLDAASGAVLAAVSRDIGRGHAEQLMAVIAEALAGAALDYENLSRIAVAVGPGSFTGVRVGVSTARGLALALGIPAVGVSTLAALAAEAGAGDLPVLAAIDARRSEIYWQMFEPSGAAGSAAAVAPIEAVLPHVRPGLHLAGSAAPLLAEAAGIADIVSMGPIAATADIATYARLGAKAAPGPAPRPLYLRAPDAKPQKALIARAP